MAPMPSTWAALPSVPAARRATASRISQRWRATPTASAPRCSSPQHPAARPRAGAGPAPDPSDLRGGADALIVQDMGLLALDLPPIALHASTQTDNRTPEKVKFLQDVGFSQVVLARELSLEQIRAISAQTQVQLEFFIHGALCVSYSGQCNISHARTGRSANRGECAQLCRLPCSCRPRRGGAGGKQPPALLGKTWIRPTTWRRDRRGHPLLQDRGRLKGLDYVKNVTAWYRQKLDAILERRPDWWPLPPVVAATASPDPKKSFNRGSTDYFLHGRQPGIDATRSPKYVGEPQMRQQVTRMASRSTASP